MYLRLALNLWSSCPNFCFIGIAVMSPLAWHRCILLCLSVFCSTGIKHKVPGARVLGGWYPKWHPTKTHPSGKLTAVPPWGREGGWHENKWVDVCEPLDQDKQASTAECHSTNQHADMLSTHHGDTVPHGVGHPLQLSGARTQKQHHLVTVVEITNHEEERPVYTKRFSRGDLVS